MNNYERIQQSLEYIEGHLTEPLPLDEAAARACFSIAHYYRIFHALVGHTVKDYIRKRRLTEAARLLLTEKSRIIDASFDYQFESQEAFTRAFKHLFGATPGKISESLLREHELEAVDLIAQYFEPDRGTTFADPRIKVLRELPPMRVASFRAESRSPEREALGRLLEWATAHGQVDRAGSYRLFGFDNPSPTPGAEIYGYEAWISVGPDAVESDGVVIKDFPGGLYAVTGTTVARIREAWNHFVRWLEVSKYREGGRQCLEEHLSPPEGDDDEILIDLYLPLAQR